MVHRVHPYGRNLHHPGRTHEPHGSAPPLVSTRFRANMIWLGKKPFEKDKDYKLKIHTQAVPVRLIEIKKVVDASDAGKVNGEPSGGAPRRGRCYSGNETTHRL
jgi:hypothetical protein